MFSLFFHSFQRKGRLPVPVSPLVLFVLCLLAGTVLFTGCSWGGNPAVIEGTWVSTYDEVFTITDTEFSSEMEWKGDVYGYYGNIVKRIPDGANAGYIIIQYTRNDNASPSAVGNYFVIHYKNLTAYSVDIAGSGKEDDPDGERGATGKATPEEAETAYTVANGYFSLPYSSCTRQ
jgi:hypothetical protein